MKRIMALALFVVCALPLVGAVAPTGCPDFEVELPQASTGAVVQAADFGFSAANDDNAAALTRALAHCREIRASRLELAPGSYRCFSARQGVVMAGLVDFTLEGKGARLIFRRPSHFWGQTQAQNVPDEANLLVTNCLRTVVQNLEMDWDWETDPLADIGTVIRTHVDDKPNSSYFDLKLDCLRHPWYGRLMPIQTMTPVNETRDRLTATRPHRLLFGLSEGHFGTRMGWLAPNRIRVWPGVKEQGVNHAPHYEGMYGEQVNRRTVSQMQTGVVYRVFHYYYGKNGLYLHSNRDFTARNIRIASCRGMGVVADGTQNHWQLINVSIDPDRDAKGRPVRPVSCTSDGIHNARSCGSARLVECRVSYNNDDALNFHDIFTIAVPRGPKTLEVVNGRGAQYARYSPGEQIELREDNYNPTGWQGVIRAIEGNLIEVDGPRLPDLKGRVFLVFNRSYVSNGLQLKDCIFEDAHFRTLVQPSDITVEGCTFRRCGGALEFLAAYTKNLWCEGNGCTNVVIRGNLFEDMRSIAPTQPWIRTCLRFPTRSETGEEGEPKGTDPGFIGHFLVESNRFVNAPAKAIDFAFGRDFIVRDNVFETQDPSASEWRLGEALAEPVLDQAGLMSYATAYRRLAEADLKADEDWIAAAGTEAFGERCRDLRARAIRSFGGFPVWTPLRARLTGSISQPGYKIEKLVLESRPGFYVTGLVYVPDGGTMKPPYPAVLVSCGHAEEGKAARVYQHAAAMMAKAGFVSLLFDPVDQGERRQFPRRKTCGMGHNACGALAVLLGESGLRIRLWDAKRMLSYLESRADVDAERIGVIGNSGGGTMAAMLAALDDRILAAAPASYISNLRRVVDGCGPQDSEQLIFGQLAWGLNHLGLLLLRSPTPTLVNSSHDDFFPIDGTLETVHALEAVARKQGTLDRYAFVEASGKHGWKAGMLSATRDWMRHWLQGEKDLPKLDSSTLRILDIATPKAKIGVDTCLPEEETWVTKKGNVRELSGNRSVYRILSDDLAIAESERRQLSRIERNRAAVLQAGIRSPGEILAKTVEVSSSVTNGLTVTRLGFVSPDGLTVPGVLVVPRLIAGSPRLFVGDRGRGAYAGEIGSAVASGRPALVVDLEGFGEIGESKRRIHVGSCADDGLGKIHYLLGESLVGRRAEQILMAAAEMKRRFGRAPEVVADGRAAIPAAHAFAASRELVPSLRLQHTPLSWTDAVRRAVKEPIQWTFSDSVQGALLTYDWPDLL